MSTSRTVMARANGTASFAIPTALGVSRLPLVHFGLDDEDVIHGHVGWRSVLEGRTIHLSDILAEPAAGEYPVSAQMGRTVGQRTIVAVALRRHGESFGYLSLVHRHQPRPFTDQK